MHYDEGGAGFLRVGRRYQVMAWWLSDHLFSGVHTANPVCSGGTVYADGSAIDTSLWRRAAIRTLVYASSVIVLAGAASLILFRRARSKRRVA